MTTAQMTELTDIDFPDNFIDNHIGERDDYETAYQEGVEALFAYYVEQYNVPAWKDGVSLLDSLMRDPYVMQGYVAGWVLD